MTKLLQFAGFKLCWFGLILIPHLAIWPALLYLLWSLWQLAAKARLAVVGISIAGIGMDTLLLKNAVFSFVDTGYLSPWLPLYLPLWLLLLWGCFALVLVQVLAKWLRHWWLAALVGAVTGPLAYWGGAALGGQLLFVDTTTFLLTLAPCWALLLALAVYCQFYGVTTMRLKFYLRSKYSAAKLRSPLLAILIAGCCSLNVGLVSAMQQPETKAAAVVHFEQYQTVGEGKYSYWFWDLYQARLATPSGKFTDYQQSVPLLLELRYLRDISKTEFVDATVDQWGIQAGGVQKQHKLWAGELSALWRDVKKGDMLSAELHADGLVSFYFNQQLLGKTKDPNLGPAFFDIWLSEKTTAPELRQLLLKQP